VRQAPAFRLVRKFADLFQRVNVVNESFFRQPSQLINPAVKDRQAFAEFLRWKRDAAQYLTGFEDTFAQCGLPRPSGAFVQMTFKKFQPLRKRLGIVRIAFDDGRGADRNRVRGTRRRGGRARTLRCR